MSEHTQKELLEIHQWLKSMGKLHKSIGPNDLPNLTVIALQNCGVSDISPLSKLTNVREMNLKAARIVDLGPLAHMTKLENVDLDGADLVRDVTPLAGLHRLEWLSLRGTSVEDLKPLSKLRKLRKLNLANTRVRDLAALSSLSSLQLLDVSGTDVSDISPLFHLARLQRGAIDPGTLALLERNYSQNLLDEHITVGVGLLGWIDLRRTKVKTSIIEVFRHEFTWCHVSGPDPNIRSRDTFGEQNDMAGEPVSHIRLRELQKILLRHGIFTHTEGGALIWNLEPRGKCELVIEIHEPHETATNTRDLWIYAPNLVPATSPLLGSLASHLSAVRDSVGYSATRLLDGSNIGAAWSVPLDSIATQEDLAELVGRLGKAAHEVWNMLKHEDKATGESKQISLGDFDAVLAYPDGRPVENPPPQSDILDRLSRAHATWERGDSDGAISQYHELLEMAEGSTPMRLTFQSKILSEMVRIIHSVGPPEKGIKYAYLALDIDRKLYGDKHNDIAADLLDLAQFCASLRRPKEALNYLEESQKVDSSLPAKGPHAPMIAYRRVSGAKVLQDIGFAEQAAHQCMEAIPDLQARLEEHPMLGHALAIAADCLQDLGEHNIAEDWLRKSVELERRSQNPSPLDLGIRLSNLALLLHESGRFEEAIRIMREAQAYPGTKREIGGAIRTLEEEIDIHGAWMAERKGKYDLFLSYNSCDEDLVRESHDALESLGLNVFTFREDPKSNLPLLMSEVMLMLQPHLDESQCLLVVVSPTSMTSIAVQLEVTHALEHDIPVLAWYPRGTRFTPEATATYADKTPGSTLRFAAYLFDNRVRSYFGFGVRGGSFRDFALDIFFRHLLLSPRHPLRKEYDLSELGRKVRHATRLQAHLVNADGEPLFREVPLSAHPKNR